MLHRTRADLEIVRPADVEPEPWANGLGVTRVLAARPAWRISLAEIEGRMPFSPFLGADRVLIPLSPEGVTIEIDGAVRHVAPHTGVAFRGEDHVVAETVGTRASVINIMTRRSSGRLGWHIRTISDALREDADAMIVLDGEVTVGRETLTSGAVSGVTSDVRATSSGGRVVLLRLPG